MAENSYQHSGESSQIQHILFLAINTLSEEESIWYLDTRCSNHMYGEKELFSSLDEMVKSTMKFGSNLNIPIVGECQIAIRLKDGSQNFIGDVSMLLVFIAIS